MEVVFIPAPPPKSAGTVTMEIPVELAAKVQALIGATNGAQDDLSAIFCDLDRTIPKGEKLVLKDGLNNACIDLHRRLRFEPRFPGVK